MLKSDPKEKSNDFALMTSYTYLSSSIEQKIGFLDLEQPMGNSFEHLDKAW